MGEVVTMALAQLRDGAPVRRCHVVFCGTTELWWLRCLKAGFRHCAVILDLGDIVVIVDPLSCGLRVGVHRGGSRHLIFTRLAAAGMCCVPVRRRLATRPLWPLRPMTCVEVVKSLIGLRAPLVWTPFQLYRRLLDSSP